MHKPTFDPGLTQQYIGTLRRAINKDGTFNVRRRGASWRHIHPYLHLINMGWASFLAVTFVAFFTVNTIFAVIYFSLGPGQLQGADAPAANLRFLNDFFFSAHTLTTVGYGSIAPSGIAANFVAALEAMTGLMGFAVITGVLFGRVSRPSARIGFSDHMLIAPYQDGTSLQFRVVNLRPNMLMNLEGNVVLMTVDGPPGDLKRSFQPLKLERDGVNFLALTWTLVHPIDETSPLYGKTAEELQRLQAEVLILIKAFDDTFSQTVHARYSYRYDEMVWGAKFKPAFEIDASGDMILEVDQVGSHALVEAAAR